MWGRQGCGGRNMCIKGTDTISLVAPHADTTCLSLTSKSSPKPLSGELLGANQP
jgi:hypothetical protein